MSEYNLTLPEDMAAFIEAQASRGGFGTVHEYILELIRREQIAQAEAELEAKLLEGLNSEAVEVNEAFWQNIRDEAMKRISSKRVA